MCIFYSTKNKLAMLAAASQFSDDLARVNVHNLTEPS
jgi:hypothetical protein